MDVVWDSIKHELALLLSLVVGAVLVHIRERVALYIKDHLGIDKSIDELVDRAEESNKDIPNSGKDKKRFVTERLKSELESKGVGIAKRVLAFGLGKIGTSINKAVKRRF